MDSKFQTSFIPKRPVVTSMEAPINVKHPVNLISVICTLIFVAAVLATGGMFAYERYLTGKISQMDSQLVAAKSSIQSDLINQFVRLDNRLTTSNALLRNHVATSILFGALQDQTVKNIQFKDFGYTTEESGGTIAVVLHGQATSYNAIALQDGIFAQDKYIQDPVFSDMDLDEKGNVIFSFKANIDPQFVAQRNIVAQQTPSSNTN
jgi:hypothetical protein